MIKQEPGLYGIKYSNRDFTQIESWGKNQFNSSFPAGLTNFLASKGLENVYLYLDKDLTVKHKKISVEQLYGIESTSEDLFFSFESPYTPYQQLLYSKFRGLRLLLPCHSLFTPILRGEGGSR